MDPANVCFGAGQVEEKGQCICQGNNRCQRREQADLGAVLKVALFITAAEFHPDPGSALPGTMTSGQVGQTHTGRGSAHLGGAARTPMEPWVFQPSRAPGIGLRSSGGGARQPGAAPGRHRPALRRPRRSSRGTGPAGLPCPVPGTPAGQLRTRSGPDGGPHRPLGCLSAGGAGTALFSRTVETSQRARF